MGENEKAITVVKAPNAYISMDSFRFWCQKVLPLVYDDSISYYEVLGKMVVYLNNMIDNQDYFKNELAKYELTVDQLVQDVNTLQSELEKVKNGDYVSLYIDSLANWIDNNLQQLVGRVVKYVYFGLTDDGYFAAYIPDSWDFIQFDTEMNYNSDLYGHLMLRW